MNLYEITGTYGGSHTPSTIFCATENNGLTWYVCEGSQNVNATYDEVTEGVDIETLNDQDCFTCSAIESLEDLERAINE